MEHAQRLLEHGLQQLLPLLKKDNEANTTHSLTTMTTNRLLPSLDLQDALMIDVSSTSFHYQSSPCFACKVFLLPQDDDDETNTTGATASTTISGEIWWAVLSYNLGLIHQVTAWQQGHVTLLAQARVYYQSALVQLHDAMELVEHTVNVTHELQQALFSNLAHVARGLDDAVCHNICLQQLRRLASSSSPSSDSAFAPSSSPATSTTTTTAHWWTEPFAPAA